MTAAQVVVHPDANAVAELTAARLLVTLVDRQSVHTPVHVVLTGGTVGIAVLAAVRSSPARDVVDWSGVHLWWGDERFLPTGHADRNETQARTALLDDLGPALPAGNVHPVPAAGSVGVTTVEDAAVAYAAELAAFTPIGAAGPAVPRFDVVLLGMGPDGHVASLFPGHPAETASGTATVAVHDAPKPPPERVSLTNEAICTADAVWIVVAGAEKAPKVAAALTGAVLPAARVHGRGSTLWLVDAAAASAELVDPAS
ncbi:MAG TPA: 6-phosphogluconolactonase [Cellulomonadaceae bacterium]|nr:6-phosphogluconolactonase [Cellulomonadaceae bacterium]